MFKWTITGVLVAVAVGLLVYPTLAQQPDLTVAALMKKKLEYNQKLLEALTLNDLDKVVAEADHLLQVRKEASFRIIKTPEYDLFADDFQRAADAMVKAAKDKNLEAAKLHYLGLTLSCFNCHAYVRDTRKRG
jgi:hypothetical protein